MDAELIRRDLKLYLNDNKKYQKLIVQIRKGKRLLYWHEKLLSEFSRKPSGYNLEYKDLSLALQICEIHEVELETGNTKVFKGCIDIWHDDFDTFIENYPNYLPSVINGLSESQGGVVKIQFCPECNRLFKESKNV